MRRLMIAAVLPRLVLGSLGLLAFSLSAVHAQGAPPAAPAPKPADPLQAAAEKAFLALDVEARRAIQRDLIWVAGFTGSASGDFGSLTFNALKRFETEAKLPVDAILAPPERERLAKEAEKARLAAKFSVETDKVSGMRVGIPGVLLVKSAPNTSGGTRWQDKDEKVTLDLSVFKPDDQLPAMFEKGTSAAVQGRKITYKLLRPEFFVITGETATGKFYRRVETDGKGQVRGFSIGYDKGVAPLVDRYLIAIAAGFEAFPKAGGTRPSGAALVADTTPKQRRATGVVLAPDAILTAEAALKGCTEIIALGEKPEDRAPMRISRRLEGSGLVLLAGKAGRALSVRAAGAADGPAVLVQRDLDGELLAGGVTIASSKAEASLQDGGAGAVLFDRSGALIGFVNAAPQTKYRVAGIVPSLSYAFAPAEEVFKAAAIVSAPAATGAPKSAAEIAELARAGVISLVCASDK